MNSEVHITSQNALALDDIYRFAVKEANDLIDQILSRTANQQSFWRLDALIGALPLPQERYAWAAARLANSQAYAMQDEHFAAAFEARLLAKRLVAEASLALIRNGNARPIRRLRRQVSGE